mmetsp:Transcript_28793/g.65372  ORF Transcript_28793/g.65372 Transcript_28793/m.65372 type:complete len:273 (-) Transcript_28793:1053-1871(-)
MLSDPWWYTATAIPVADWALWRLSRCSCRLGLPYVPSIALGLEKATGSTFLWVGLSVMTWQQSLLRFAVPTLVGLLVFGADPWVRRAVLCTHLATAVSRQLSLIPRSGTWRNSQVSSHRTLSTCLSRCRLSWCRWRWSLCAVWCSRKLDSIFPMCRRGSTLGPLRCPRCFLLRERTISFLPATPWICTQPIQVRSRSCCLKVTTTPDVRRMCFTESVSSFCNSLESRLLRLVPGAGLGALTSGCPLVTVLDSFPCQPVIAGALAGCTTSGTA